MNVITRTFPRTSNPSEGDARNEVEHLIHDAAKLLGDALLMMEEQRADFAAYPSALPSFDDLVSLLYTIQVADHESCAECSRSNGPHYSGPCEH